MDIASRLAVLENGGMDEDDTLSLFQDLIDSGVIYHLQGSYQRQAARYIESGYCLPPPSHRQPLDLHALDSEWARSGIHVWRAA